jgi:trypsin
MIPSYRLSYRFAAAVAALVALPAAAIQTRPDREDSEYLELATKYTSAVLVSPAGGEGALIAPRWVLTAGVLANRVREAKKIRIGSADYEIEEVFKRDLALVLLRKPVKDVKPTPAYAGDDEKGKTVVIAGHGGDKRKRAAINTVDRVEAKSLGLEVKALDAASDLQGSASPSETGAPLFIETGDGIFVAGIGDRNTGEVDLYTRVSAHYSWIEAQMLDVARREADALLGGDNR